MDVTSLVAIAKLRHTLTPLRKSIILKCASAMDQNIAQAEEEEGKDQCIWPSPKPTVASTPNI